MNIKRSLKKEKVINRTDPNPIPKLLIVPSIVFKNWESG
jgi:hypothetical protein